MNIQEAVKILGTSDAFNRLSERDQTFASSLLRAASGRWGVSEKQAKWLVILAERATQVQPERAKTAIGDLQGINALFAKAQQHLKRPAIVLSVEGLGSIRLSVAGAGARVPGSINVATVGAFGDRDWYGRILQDGNFEASPRISTPTGLVKKLQRFACEPAKVAAEHGRLTGSCCFCNRELTDERSTSVGYGPICADHFGLPWGELPQVHGDWQAPEGFTSTAETHVRKPAAMFNDDPLPDEMDAAA